MSLIKKKNNLKNKKNNYHINTYSDYSNSSDSSVSPRTMRKILALEEDNKSNSIIFYNDNNKNTDFRLCDICESGNDLILCNGLCGRFFHSECLDIRKADIRKNWVCRDCLANKVLL